jgi:hypothetical protein
MLTCKDILEHSGLAWPNSRAFANIPREPRRPGPIGSRVCHDAHAHSPLPHQNIGNRPPAAYRQSHMSDDPFVGPPAPAPQWRMRFRASSTDESMPGSERARDRRENTGSEMSVQYQRRDFARQLDEATFDEIATSLSPEKAKQLADQLGSSSRESGGMEGVSIIKTRSMLFREASAQRK